MSDMADVLRTHTRRPGTRDLAIHCECGWSESILSMRSSKGSFAAHQATALSAAGFGPVKEARETIQRLNRRAQVAESALNAVTSEGRAGIREDKLLREYWQRAEDARAALEEAEASCCCGTCGL